MNSAHFSAPCRCSASRRRADGHPVLGAARACRFRYLDAPAAQLPEEPRLCRQRLAAGRNLGLRDGVQHAMVDLVRELGDAHGRKISLVGWSLGGLYARQLAKMMPDRVRSVITLGSPFAGNPKTTNAWRVYELASGRRADEEEARFGGSLEETPPVPTTAIFSRTDGICAWQGCMEKPSALSENIEVESSIAAWDITPRWSTPWRNVWPSLKANGPRSTAAAGAVSCIRIRLDRSRALPYLAPLAGRGRSRRLRVRGTIRESECVETPPHPNPLPASGARGEVTSFQAAVVATPQIALCVTHGASACPHHRSAQARTLAHRLHRHHRVWRRDRAARRFGVARHAPGVFRDHRHRQRRGAHRDVAAGRGRLAGAP